MSVTEQDIVLLAGDARRGSSISKGARVLPGLIDNADLHLIRGGLNFNLELRWDGVRSLADAMVDVAARQVAITPPPQWGPRGGPDPPSISSPKKRFANPHRGTERGRAGHAGVPAAPLTIGRSWNAAGAARLSAIPGKRPNPPAARSCATRKANRPGSCWPNPMPAFSHSTSGHGVARSCRLDYQLNSGSRHFMRRS